MARQSKAIPSALVAVAAAVAAYWYWSPLLVLRQLKQAVRVHDAPAFNRHVDYPALRENMKDQIGGKPERDSALGGIGRLLGGVMVDALVRPQMVMYVLEHGDFATKPRRDDPPAGDSGANGEGEGAMQQGEARPAWVSQREGVNRYIVQNDRIALVFVRNGFADWKLSELRY